MWVIVAVKNEIWTGDTSIIITLQRQISNHRCIRGIADASTALTLYQKLF